LFTATSLYLRHALRGGCLYFLLSPVFAQDAGVPTTVLVENGTVTFDASTNLSAISVHGKSNGLQARVRIRQHGGELMVEQVTANLPIDALSTGMKSRDEHMRKYIFTNPDGQTPNLQFTSANLVCPAVSGKETSCKVTGQLAIRGTERPLSMTLKVKADGASKVFRASGEGIVKLSDYGIERPSQLGVKCADEVKIHIEFLGKERVESAVRWEGGR
jgi:polyisoprenoid-binding protein YceI